MPDKPELIDLCFRILRGDLMLNRDGLKTNNVPDLIADRVRRLTPGQRAAGYAKCLVQTRLVSMDHGPRLMIPCEKDTVGRGQRAPLSRSRRSTWGRRSDNDARRRWDGQDESAMLRALPRPGAMWRFVEALMNLYRLHCNAARGHW